MQDLCCMLGSRRCRRRSSTLIIMAHGRRPRAADGAGDGAGLVRIIEAEGITPITVAVELDQHSV
jgi:hypothetical protein